jgi:hypothetical protein
MESFSALVRVGASVNIFIIGTEAHVFAQSIIVLLS